MKQQKQNFMCHRRLSKCRLLLGRECKRKLFEFECTYSANIKQMLGTHDSSHWGYTVMNPTYIIPVVVELVFYGGEKKYNKQKWQFQIWWILEENKIWLRSEKP